MQGKIARILFAVVLVVYLLAAAFSVEGSVLCVGEDGHIAIEFVNACGGSESSAQLAGTEGDGCGTCLDVQMVTSPAHTRAVSHFPQSHSVICSTPVSLPALPKEHFKTHGNLPEYSVSPSLASLHSIVLLI
jgi:hypothetical protein